MERHTNEKRAEWLELAQQLVSKALARRSLYDHELAPDNSLPSDDDRKSAQKKANELTRDITTLTQRLALIERQAPIGSKALDIDDDLARTVLAILVTARLSTYIAREAKRIGDIVDLAGGQDSEKRLSVRCLLGENNLLFPHVWIGKSPVLDEAIVYLTETAFGRINGLESGSERMCDAVGMLGRWERQ